MLLFQIKITLFTHNELLKTPNLWLVRRALSKGAISTKLLVTLFQSDAFAKLKIFNYNTKFS